jgi:hypothetical protein
MAILVSVAFIIGLILTLTILVIIVRGYELAIEMMWEFLEFTYRAGSYFLIKIFGR